MAGWTDSCPPGEQRCIELEEIVMPVRKVVTRSGKKFRGRFPSRKNATMVCWESLHERDAILYLEYSANVVSYEEQPSEEIFYVRGAPHRYYPDFRAKLVNEQIVDIEIKPWRKMLCAQMKEKYGRIASMYQRSGRHFRLLTERDYRAQPLLANFRLIHRSKNCIRRETDAALLLLKLGSGPEWTLEQAGRLLGNSTRALSLVAWGALCIDLRAPIEALTPIWLPGTKEGDHDPIQF